MYIYEFIRAIDLLKKENTPEYLTLEENALVYDCLERKEAEKYISLPEKGEHFLLYDIDSKLNYTDVTVYVEYMDKLKAENITVPQNDPENKLFKAKLIEAIGLFDLVTLSTRFKDIFSVYEDLSSVYMLYGVKKFLRKMYTGNIFNIELFKSQFLFFVAKYLEISLKDEKTEKKPITYADSFIYDILNGTGGFYAEDISEITGIKNKEFDDIVTQLNSDVRPKRPSVFNINLLDKKDLTD